MKCCYCGQGIDEGKSIFPIDPKGKSRRWSCTDCTSTKDVPQDVREICGLINPSFNTVKCFEIGKYYRHTTGHEIAVLCETETTLRGKGLVAETNNPTEELCMVGTSEENAINYIEITKEEWMKNFS